MIFGGLFYCLISKSRTFDVLMFFVCSPTFIIKHNMTCFSKDRNYPANNIILKEQRISQRGFS